MQHSLPETLPQSTDTSFGDRPLGSSTHSSTLPASAYHCHGFRFHGSASEYFGIWMVNIMLMIVTLTLYSPWAKAKRMRYFYGNTQFLNYRFDFVALPSRIFWGRLFALELYVLSLIVMHYSLVGAEVLFLVVCLVLPWLIRMTLKFRARNTKFGNTRFYFSGNHKEAYRALFIAIVVNILTLFLFFPVVIWLYKRYVFNHLHIGRLSFHLDLNWTKFMSAVYLPILLSFAVGIAWIMIVAYFKQRLGLNIFTGTLILGYVFSLMMIYPWVLSRLFITTCNHLKVGQSYFKTTAKSWRYAWIVLSNLLLKVCSLGLLTPWAAIRLYQYQVQSLQLFVAEQDSHLHFVLQKEPAAIANELLDLFDVDASL